MARAKRTHRAEARRRYRTEQAIGAFEDDADSESIERATPETPRPGTTTTARRGFAAAFREAFRPVNVPEDLRSIPMLVRHKALWIPILLTIGTAVLFVAVSPESRPEGDPIAILTRFAKEYFLVPPAIGGAFITGFMAPRASWLLGIMVGLVAAAAYSVLALNGYPVFAPTSGPPPRPEDAALAAFAISPVIGAFFASTAAWYRRFLYLTNPNRGRARSGAPARPDGRSRSGNANQKAGVRR